jgi:serine/threonine protein kinase
VSSLLFLIKSPEQTGRISKNIDFRSDIYSLGITFYQILSGDVPFKGDKISLVHSQITKKIPKLEGVPNQINYILEKMTQKNQRDRYSTALGVQKDLKRCLEFFSTLNDLSFLCGEKETEIFHIPNKLYGRKGELECLKTFINSKNSNMCCVSGISGSGKSKIIESLLDDKKLNYFIVSGKFDQYDRSTPYSAFIKLYLLFNSSVFANHC